MILYDPTPIPAPTSISAAPAIAARTFISASRYSSWGFRLCVSELLTTEHGGSKLPIESVVRLILLWVNEHLCLEVYTRRSISVKPVSRESWRMLPPLQVGCSYESTTHAASKRVSLLSRIHGHLQGEQAPSLLPLFLVQLTTGEK